MLFEDLTIKRSLHTSVCFWKEDTVVEKSVKALKDQVGDKKQTEGEKDSGKVNKVAKKEKDPPPKGFWVKRKEKWSATLAEMRKTGYLRYFWNAFKAFVLHYKDGFVLFWKNFKYCMPLLIKYLRQGRSSLKRREYKLVSNT